MSMTRTTLRLDEKLKKEVEKYALEGNTTMQAVYNEALADYLHKQAKVRARKIVFKTHDLNEPLDDLDRNDYYPELK